MPTRYCYSPRWRTGCTASRPNPLPYLVLGALCVALPGFARRRCELHGDRLRVFGRYSYREVALADLVQVAPAMGGVWVQSSSPVDQRGSTVLYLRMIATSRTSAQRLAEDDAIRLLRARAEAAGARLPPLPARASYPPRAGQRLYFGN